MTANPFDLERTTGWMQAVIMHSQGTQSGVLSHAAQQRFEIGPDEIERIIKPSRSLSAGERLAIYNRAYHARLLECFRAEYPALRHALGDELFDRFALDYLERYPSASYTLHKLAAQFPQHLAETRPDRDAAPEERETWPEFIIDVAQLERAITEIYHGPGAEKLDAVTVDQIGEMCEDELRETAFTPSPCLRLLQCSYPVGQYVTAVKNGAQPRLPDPAMSYIAVYRRNYIVRLYEMKPAEFRLLRDVVEKGRTVGETLCASAYKAEITNSKTQHMRDLMSTWAELGFFVNNAKPTR